MTIPAPPQNWPRHSSVAVNLLSGALKYGPTFIAQVGWFYFLLAVGQVMATGQLGSRAVLVLGFLLVLIATGVGEFHFRLYKRVWAVAGLSDAIALALAVVEVSAIITLID